MQPEIEIEGRRKVRQPRAFDRFRCTGANCEDTCCIGWGVPVDRETYQKYQNTPALQVSGQPLSGLVEINPAGSSNSDYARLRMDKAVCPALTGKLCGIQISAGESYMPALCVKYPRVFNVLGQTVERSLDLSCPEAARLVLADPDAMMFQNGQEGSADHPRLVNFVADDPDDLLFRIRKLLIALIQQRSLPLWQRIRAIGFAVDRLADVGLADAVPLLEDHLKSIKLGMFNDALAGPQPDSKFQLETVLEIVVARLSSDYTPPRFVGCYRDFLLGLAWTPDASMENLASRYDSACRRFFAPFVHAHPHVFENYLISYIFATVFPYRSKLASGKFAIDSSRESMQHSFVLLALHYAILRTLLIGMSALHGDNLKIEHATMLVQSFSKAFVHGAFDSAAFEYLRKTVSDPASRVAELVMDPPLHEAVSNPSHITLR